MKQRSRSATGQLLSRGHGQAIDAVGIADVVEVEADARLPHEREAAPQEAERHQEDVDSLEDHARVGLAGPQQALAGEQLALQTQLGERHLPPRTFRGSSASLNPSPM